MIINQVITIPFTPYILFILFIQILHYPNLLLFVSLLPLANLVKQENAVNYQTCVIQTKKLLIITILLLLLNQNACIIEKLQRRIQLTKIKLFLNPLPRKAEKKADADILIYYNLPVN